MKVKIKNNQSGITLIALVITIIVLLILAGVAISMLVGDNGILKQAAKAKENTTVSSIEEQLKLAVLSSRTEGLGDIDLTALNTELKKIDSNIEEITALPKNLTVKGNDFRIDENGNVTAALWYYDDNGNVTNGRITLEIGDEVFYKVKENEKCEIASSETGYTGSEKQVFNTSDYEGGWQVLGVEDGKIMLTSSVVILPSEGAGSHQGFVLYGQTGYVNSVDVLNRASGIYGKGENAESARSIRIEDINRIAGVNPEESDENINNYSQEKRFTKNSSDGYIYYQVKKNGVLQGESQTDRDTDFIYNEGDKWITLNSGESVDLICSSYSYEFKNLTSKAEGMICKGEEIGTALGNPENSIYWIASKMSWAPNSYIYYGLPYINTFYDSNAWLYAPDTVPLCDTTGWNCENEMGLRPVVYLKPDIKLTGSSDAGWNIE